MKIKEIQAGIKITRNYDSYQASLTADIETGENPEKIGMELMEKASEIVNEKILSELDKKPLKVRKINKIEIGAAWPSKKFKDKLSVKDNETGKWSAVKMIDLEKVGEDYKRETSEGVFKFKKLSEKERKNNQMPMYRIYKIGGFGK